MDVSELKARKEKSEEVINEAIKAELDSLAKDTGLSIKSIELTTLTDYGMVGGRGIPCLRKVSIELDI